MVSNTEITPHGKFGSHWYAREGVVYFVSAGANCEACKSIKIGVSTRDGLLSRLKGIQSANHARIRLLRVILVNTMLDAEQTEKELHGRFHELARIPGDSVGHEWFTASPQLMEFIQKDAVPIEQEMVGLPNADMIVKLFADSH